MKKYLFFFSAFFLSVVHAQTVDDIIRQYSEAAGGLDNFNKIKTALVTGTVTVQGTELPVTIHVINNKAMCMDIDIMGMKITNCYYDGKGWKVNPFSGDEEPADVTGSELAELKSQSMLASPLMDYKSRGHKVELLGQEEVDGVKTHKIKLTSKDDGKVTLFFVGIADGLLVKSISTRQIQGELYELETYHSHYKKINGLQFAMNRKQYIEGNLIQELTVESIELDVEIDEKIFEKK